MPLQRFSRLPLTPLLLPLMVCFYCSLALAEHHPSIEEVEVYGQRTDASAAQLGNAEDLLKAPGLNFSAAGGVSGLPVLNGMMSDRIKVLIDGADITAACGNSMNPPLSYVSASQIAAYQVVAGISPVSLGDDNIAGVIRVDTIAPKFGQADAFAWSAGYLSAGYRSNGDGRAAGLGAVLASSSVSVSYRGALEQSNSHQDGAGNTQLDTLYKAQNHSLVTAVKDDTQQLAIKLNYQSIPYQGFPNQYMDMTDNTSYGLLTRYQRTLEAGELKAHINWQKVSHAMGFFSREKTGQMPMDTSSEDLSYQLSWSHNLSDHTTLKLAQEYYDFRIDDWWPAVEGSMMMGPNDYININDGSRKRLSAYAELESHVNQNLWFSLGARATQVQTNSAAVQDYSNDTGDVDGMDTGMGMDMGDMDNMMDMSHNNLDAAAAFNAQPRKKHDTLIDATAQMTYQLSNSEQLQLGLARKNRAPNLYERYTWGVSDMSATMIGWFGDGNGYIGDTNLKPETANTISASYNKALADNRWVFSGNLWYSKLNNYIDANPVRPSDRPNAAGQPRNILQFTNIDATLYGAQLELTGKLHNSSQWGEWQLNASASNTRGSRDDSRQPLYQIMPWQSSVALQQTMGQVESSLTWQWVDDKTRLDANRLENPTQSYHLVSFDTQISWNKLTLGLEVSNVFNQHYQQPLGGVNIAQFKNDASRGFEQMYGKGRSVNLYTRIGF